MDLAQVTAPTRADRLAGLAQTDPSCGYGKKPHSGHRPSTVGGKTPGNMRNHIADHQDIRHNPGIDSKRQLIHESMPCGSGRADLD
jgi:hypothetical protein